jgi:chromosome partitioning protein
VIDGKAQMRTFKFHWTIGILNLMFTCIAADAVRLIKQAQSVRQGPPQTLMFLSRAVKGTKLKTEAMELLGKLAPTIKVLKSIVHQKQVITDSSGQAATVWDWGDQPASYSGKEYNLLFKEIMGALT